MIFDFISTDTIWNIIIVPYLSLNDVAKLELAFTSHLLAIQKNYIFYNLTWNANDVINIDSKIFAQWLFNRKICTPNVKWTIEASYLKYLNSGVNRLVFSDVCNSVSYKVLINLLSKNTSTLEILHLPKMSITPNNLLEISKLTQNLKSLHLYDESQIFGIEIIPLLWPNIKSIHLSSKLLNTNKTFDNNIDISSYSSVHTIDYSNVMTNSLLIKISKWFPCLHSISLNSCKFMTNISFITLFTNVPTIESIALTDCLHINYETFQKLAEVYNNKLSSISFTNCPNLDSLSMNCISSQCNNLKDIQFNSCNLIDDISLTELIINNKYLKKFKILNCIKITSNICYSFLLLENYIELIDISIYKNNFHNYYSNCKVNNIINKSLKILKLSSNDNNLIDYFSNNIININNINFNYNIGNYINISLSDYIQSYHYIKILNLSNCNQLHNNKLKEISISKFSNILEELYLSNCILIEENGIEYIAMKCINLKILDISGIPNIKNYGINIIYYNFYKLKYLIAKSLYNYEYYHDYNNNIDKIYSKLQFIDFQYSNITFHILKHICLICKNLETIIIYFKCKTISYREIKLLQKDYPNLLIKRMDIGEKN